MQSALSADGDLTPLRVQDKMQRPLKILLAFFAFLTVGSFPGAGVAASEKRLALVVGNASYNAKALGTPVNDAALVAQTLQLAGFDVVGARDLDQDLLRRTFSDFTNKVAAAGKDPIVFVYFSGYGVQLAGTNYLLPINTESFERANLPARAMSLSELMEALGVLKPKATFIVLDATRPGLNPPPGQAGGLAWTEPEQNMLIAFSAAPGTLARDAVGGFGPYAKSLAEMIREGD